MNESGRLYGINVCGEGGEYETLTLDCPLFKVSVNFLKGNDLQWQLFFWSKKDIEFLQHRQETCV